MLISDEQLIDSMGNKYNVVLWDHTTPINGIDVNMFVRSYPFAKDTNADVILVLINNSYDAVKRVEDPSVLKNRYSLNDDTTINEIVDKLKDELYNEFQQEKSITENQNLEIQEK